MIDERTERLINRKLDGELTESEALELDKLLIRSPEAQALLAEYQGNDALSSEALQSAADGDGAGDDASQPWLRAERSSRRRWRYYLAAASAIAAAIVLAVTLEYGPVEKQPTQPIVKQPPAIKNVQVQDDKPVTVNRVPMIACAGTFEKLKPVEVIDGPRQQREQTMREVLGVYDQETQSVYLLEMDRTRQTIVPVSMNY